MNGRAAPLRHATDAPDMEPLAATAAATDDRARLQQLWARVGQVYALSVAIGCSLTLLVALAGLPGPQRLPLLAVWGTVILAALVASRLHGRWAVPAALAVGVLGTLALVLSSAMFGWGSSAPLLGFMTLHAAFAAAIGGLAGGLLVAAVALGGIAWLEAGLPAGLAGPAAAGAAIAPWVAPVIQAAVVAVGVASGLIAAWALARFAASADERQRRFQGLLQIAADAYWELDPQYRLRALTAERRGNWPPADASALGQIPWEHPAFACDADALDRLQADLGARQRFRDVRVDWHTADGERHLLVSGEPRFDARGMFRGYWGVARDITDDLRARRALVQTESRFQDLFASIPTPLVLHRSGRVIDANPAAQLLFGFDDAASMVGVDLLALYDGSDSRERARRRIEALQAMAPGESLPVTEFRLVARSGRRLQVRGTGVAMLVDEGPAILSIYVDDTERHQAEQAVRRSEALLSHLVASSPDVILLSELATGRYAMVNQTFERLTGWSAGEVIGRTALEVGIWHDEAEREAFAEQLREHGRVQDLALRLRHRDGQPIPVRVSGARFVMDRRDYLVVNARDMSQAERERLEREAILDNASIGIALTRDQRFQRVNPAFEAMLGWPPGAIVGQPGATVWPSEEAYAAIGRQIGPVLARGEPIEIECEIRRRDGSLFLCRMLARAVDPRHPSQGGTIWIVEDITERRRVDEALARARDAAEAANRAKSAFLANTSHELRTPLNQLVGLAQLARDPATDGTTRTQYLEHIVDSAQLLAQIVSDILDLSKIEAGKLELADEPFDLPAMLRQVQRGYLALAERRGVACAIEVDPALGWVRGDALRVRQILSNYLGNAFKFTAAGEVRMVARRVGERVRLEVHDTGPGVEPALRERLFRPFTQADDSTTRRFGGTGLGLSICRELAERMGGEVGVASEPGRGSCFWTELPLAVWTPPAATAAAPELPAVVAGAHVLVVDDDEVNRMVAVAQLERLGVRVGVAGDGQQALDAVAAASAAGDGFDLVLMDLQMPVKSGFEVTRELRRRFSPAQLPIVAHTAAVLVSEREAALSAGMNDFLPKPSTDPELMRTIVARWAGERRAAALSPG